MKTFLFTSLILGFLFCVGVSLAQPSATFFINLADTSPFDHFWEECVGSGHALLALREDWRHQLKNAHDKLGMKRVRFHGIFDDDLSAYQNESGQAVYSWYNQDQIYDYLLSIGMQPYVELSFMPEEMASGTKTIFHYKGNITPPKDYALWADMLINFAQHMIQRYGVEEVRSWFFETWNEPNCGFWSGNQTEYYQLLNVTVTALKSVDPYLQIGGPTTCQSAWINETLAYVTENNIPLGFVSTHQYPTDLLPLTRGTLRKVMQQSRNDVGPDRLLFYSETNDGLFEYQLHDTVYASAFAVFNMIDLQGIADIVSWWSFSDIFEEGGFNSVPYNRGYGLQTIYNVNKPAFKAFELLHESGQFQFAVQGSHPTAGLVATKNETHYLVLMYNHNIPNATIEPVNMTVTLAAIEPLNYLLTLRRIDENNCNSLAVWESMGQPEYPDHKEIKLLQDNSEFVHYPLEYQTVGDGLTFSVEVPPHGVASVTFKVLP